MSDLFYEEDLAWHRAIVKATERRANMGVRILQGDQPYDGACIYCSTSGTAFGPIFEDAQEAQDFLDWLVVDARRFDDNELHSKYVDFREEREQQQKEEQEQEQEEETEPST